MTARLVLVLMIDIYQNLIKRINKIDKSKMMWAKRDDYNTSEKSFWCVAFLNMIIWMPFVLYIVIQYPSYITFSLLWTQILYAVFKNNEYIKTTIDILYIWLLIAFWIIYL